MQRKSKLKTSKPLVKNAPSSSIQDCDAQAQSELEICWCVQKLEDSISSGKLNKKLQEDSLRNLRVLKSGTTPVIRKRQVMSATFGDYRSKMKEEEKKMSLAVKQIKFTSGGEGAKKSSFVKKATLLSSENGVKSKSATESLEKHNIHLENAIEKGCNGPTSDFMFNFKIEDANDLLDFDKLRISS